MVTKLDQDSGETEFPHHVYANVINLSEKKDGDPQNDNCHVRVLYDVMKTSTSARSSKCQTGNHNDHFGKLNFAVTVKDRRSALQL